MGFRKSSNLCSCMSPSFLPAWNIPLVSNLPRALLFPLGGLRWRYHSILSAPSSAERGKHFTRAVSLTALYPSSRTCVFIMQWEVMCFQTVALKRSLSVALSISPLCLGFPVCSTGMCHSGTWPSLLHEEILLQTTMKLFVEHWEAVGKKLPWAWKMIGLQGMED